MSVEQVYHSFNGFEQMRAEARSGNAEATTGAAKQFESIFVQMMLKAMRDTVPEGGLFEGEQMDFYQGMFDQQISLNIANGQGIGLAKVIERQLGAMSNGAKSSSTESNSASPGDELEAALKMPVRSPFAALGVPGLRVGIDGATGAGAANSGGVESVRNKTLRQGDQLAAPSWAPASPQAFTNELRPFARRAAAELGVSENVLIAQAALETGWGQKMIQHSNGGSSFNLFGIKANSSWEGDTASTATLEYRNGVAERERAEFRAYDSLESAFDDYVAFLRGQPRYGDALNAVGDSGFAKGLQSGGYATDPRYAEKILAVKNQIDRDWSGNLVSGLTAAGDRS